MSDVVHAFLESPQFERGALFIVYDEWGGFFDHVRPPRVPDVRSSASVAEDFGQMGMRIPAVLVSPYAKRNHVDHNIYGFESILALIRYRFGLSPLTTRDRYARNIVRSFDFESTELRNPQPARPADGDGERVHGARKSGEGLDQGPLTAAERPKEHDLAQLHTSGYLERLGFDYRARDARADLPPPLEARAEALRRALAAALGGRGGTGPDRRDARMRRSSRSASRRTRPGR